MHSQPVLRKFAFVTSVLTLIFYTSVISAFAQCPEISSDEIEIDVDQGTRRIDIRADSDINFRRMALSLYNMDDGAYYYDTEKRKDVVDIRGLSVNVRSNELEVRNLIPGDFVIIIENNGCAKQVIGWGFSGLPNSGIRIEE